MEIQKIDLLAGLKKPVASDKNSDKSNPAVDPSNDSRRIEYYALGNDRLSVVRESLINFDSTSFWDPKFQAWRPLYLQYFTSGNSPELTRQYLQDIYDKTDWLDIPTNLYSNLYNQILLFKSTNKPDLFANFSYAAIQDFCTNQALPYIRDRNNKFKLVQDRGIYEDVITQLLNAPDYKSLMCALNLYRSKVNTKFDWTDEITYALAERLQPWIEEFFAEYQKIGNMLGELLPRYEWYTDPIQKCLYNLWTTCLQPKGERGIVIDPAVIRGLTQKTIRDINDYYRNSPPGHCINLEGTAVFDAYYQIYFNNDATSESNARNCYHALYVPRANYIKFCNILEEFYQLVEDNELTKSLVYRVIYANYRGQDYDPYLYHDGLVARGFPPVDMASL